MNFTRDPIIETVISPKEGYKLVVRSSKGGGQEEFFVDSIQVVLIGGNCFYRSLEKPKAFMVPASDYEILEVRETKVALKLPTAEKGGIKIGGGREAPVKVAREPLKEEEGEEEAEPSAPVEQRGERRKDKKRFRKRRDRFEKEGEGVAEAPPTFPGEGGESQPREPREEKVHFIIPPPSTLISETIARYKDIPGFAAAFFEKESSLEREEEEERVPPQPAKEEEPPF